LKSDISIQKLLENVLQSFESKNSKIQYLFIGGLSRSGKSTLSKNIYNELSKIKKCHVISLDSWIIDYDQRSPNSTVLERYNIEEIKQFFLNLSNSNTVSIPKYDPILRKRVIDDYTEKLFITEGLVIVEGVIALEVAKLVSLEGFKIYVNVSNYTRIKRLITFYRDYKKVHKNEYKKIIIERELEEIPFIKKTASFADIFFNF
jgi:uridine kinase